MFLRSLRQSTLTRPLILAGLVLLAAPVAHGQGGLVAPAGIEVESKSLTRDASADVRRFGQLDAETLADPAAKGFTDGYTPIMFEDGEGFPGLNSWARTDLNSINGNDLWNRVNGCRSRGGRSIWAGDTAQLCEGYANPMESWMTFGPFSLADATAARVEFFAWSDLEINFDTLFVGVSTNDFAYQGFTLASQYDWSRFEFDFTGDQLGQQNVWLAFVFESDLTIVREGVYLDDILLEKLVPADVGPSPPTAPSNLTATPTSSDTIRLLWSDNSDNEDEFRIEMNSPGGALEIGLVSANSTEFDVVDLGPNTTYDFRVRARNSGGNSAFSNVATATTAPGIPQECVPDATTVCLNNDRFKVVVQWDTGSETGAGQIVPAGTDNSSNLWFFTSDNWEMLIKVLDGCAINNNFWVYFAATTDVGFTVTVTDTQTSQVRTYTNPLGQAANAVTDTEAFMACP